MVNNVMTKLVAQEENSLASSRAAAPRLTLSAVVQRFGILFWLLLCLAFWIGVARLVF